VQICWLPNYHLVAISDWMNVGLGVLTSFKICREISSGPVDLFTSILESKFWTLNCYFNV